METIALTFIVLVVAIFAYSLFKIVKFFTLKNSQSRYEYEIVEDEGIVYEKVVDRYDIKE